jgi:hypothetical protein
MAWRISGTCAASCSCNLICPCPADATQSRETEAQSEAGPRRWAAPFSVVRP